VRPPIQHVRLRPYAIEHAVLMLRPPVVARAVAVAARIPQQLTIGLRSVGKLRRRRRRPIDILRLDLLQRPGRVLDRLRMVLDHVTTLGTLRRQWWLEIVALWTFLRQVHDRRAAQLRQSVVKLVMVNLGDKP